MISLITCCNLKFLNKAIKCLESSYLVNPSICHCLYFVGNDFDIKIPEFITVKYIPDNPKNLNDIFLFAYKYWAILKELETSNLVLYTDSTHLIKKSFIDIDKYFHNDCFILTYKSGQFLIKDWTTKKCLEFLSANEYLNIPQVWAGFQGYKLTDKNIEFLKKILYLCLDEQLSGPYPWIHNPDGKNSECLYHRNDQSILSIELLKNDLYPDFSIQKNYEFGDYLSEKYFYPEDYDGDVLNSIYRCLYPRYFK